jgi:hypothetical protein
VRNIYFRSILGGIWETVVFFFLNVPHLRSYKFSIFHLCLRTIPFVPVVDIYWGIVDK